MSKLCARGLHEMGGSNLRIKVDPRTGEQMRRCRQCSYDRQNAVRRESSLCDRCNRWLVGDEAWDSHFHYPSGHPEQPPDRCLTDAEMRSRGMQPKGTGKPGEVMWLVLASPTHCVNGHSFTPTNTYIPPGRTDRQCRQCIRDRSREYQRRQRAKATV